MTFLTAMDGPALRAAVWTTRTAVALRPERREADS